MEPSSALPLRLLLIDDEREFCAVCQIVLADEGCEVETVHNGREALNRLRRSERLPDLILLDLVMPELDGWEFRREQLKCPRLSQVPTVVLSACREDQISLPELHPLAIMEKPISLEQLRNLVSESRARTTQLCG